MAFSNGWNHSMLVFDILFGVLKTGLTLLELSNKRVKVVEHLKNYNAIFFYQGLFNAIK